MSSSFADGRNFQLKIWTPTISNISHVLAQKREFLFFVLRDTYSREISVSEVLGEQFRAIQNRHASNCANCKYGAQHLRGTINVCINVNVSREA